MAKKRIYDRWYWPLLMLAALMVGMGVGVYLFMGKLLTCVGVG